MRYRVTIITRARVLRGWSQNDLARAVGKDASTISKIENGLVIGHAPTMKKIADVLNIPMEDLIEMDERSA